MYWRGIPITGRKDISRNVEQLATAKYPRWSPFDLDLTTCSYRESRVVNSVALISGESKIDCLPTGAQVCTPEPPCPANSPWKLLIIYAIQLGSFAQTFFQRNLDKQRSVVLPEYRNLLNFLSFAICTDRQSGLGMRKAWLFWTRFAVWTNLLST